jgi:orotate phosphoribosyltransferase-like protein
MSKLKDLTDEELRLLIRGMTLKDIADYFEVSEGTVSAMVTNTFKVERSSTFLIRDTIGAWMDSEERVSCRGGFANEWQKLKSTNLYKKLIENE